MQLPKNSFEKNNFVFIGKIAKTHGISGKLVIALNSENLQFKKLGSIMLEINGLLVPFFISPNSVSISDSSIILHLESISDEKEGRKFIGMEVFVEKKFLKKETSTQLNSLVNYKVIDTIAGELGFLEEIDDIPGNPVIIVKATSKEILLPVNGIEIIEINDQKKELIITAPEGLISLFD